MWVRSHGPPVGVHVGLLPHAHVCRFGRCAATTPIPAACQDVAAASLAVLFLIFSPGAHVCGLADASSVVVVSLQCACAGQPPPLRACVL